MRRLYLDLETSPNVGFFWSAGYRVDISHEQIIHERRIITAAWKWEDNKKVYSLDWGKDRDDENLVKELIPVMNDADEIVAHYGSGFDVPWVRTRAMYHGVIAPIWKVVDTKSWSSGYFLLNSNKLDYLAKYLDIGTKIRTEYDLWKDATMGNAKTAKAALDKMVRYNKHDVELLEPVYEKLSLYCPLHTHAGVLAGGEKWSCQKCASERVTHGRAMVSRAGTLTHHMQCLDCKKFFIISNTTYQKWLNRNK